MLGMKVYCLSVKLYLCTGPLTAEIRHINRLILPARKILSSRHSMGECPRQVTALQGLNIDLGRVI